LGNSIDTSFVDLKGGTTGQVLSKASNTDLDFTWVAQDDSNAIQNAIVDAKGDLISATAADTPARLAVGTNGYILTADSAEATGLKWVAPATSASGLTFIKKQTVGTSVTSVEVTSAFSSTYDNYLITYTGGSASSNSNDLNIRFGSVTTGYKYVGIYQQFTSSTVNSYATTSAGAIGCGGMSGNGACSFIYVMGPFLNGRTTTIAHTSTNHNDMYYQDYRGCLDDANSYTSFKIGSTIAFTGGEIRVYGYQNS
jgi:hypothetical protein